MPLIDLPVELLFEVCWHVDYTDLLSMLQIPELAVRLKQFVRLVTDHSSYPFPPFDGFSGLPVHSLSDQYPDYSINIVMSSADHFIQARLGSQNNHTKSFIATLRDGIIMEDVDPTGRNSRDNVFWRFDIYDFKANYEPFLIRNSVVVTQERGVSLAGDVKRGSLTGPNLELVRFAVSNKVHPGFFHNLDVKRIMVFASDQSVLDTVMEHCNTHPVVQTLNVIGVYRTPGESPFYIWEDGIMVHHLATHLSIRNMNHLTRLTLKMMNDVSDLYLPKVRELVISVTPDTHAAGVKTIPICRGIDAPECIDFDFSFFQMVPEFSDVRLPKCRKIALSFYFDKNHQSVFEDEYAYQRFDPKAYSRTIDLPAVETLELCDTLNYVKPELLLKAKQLTIHQGRVPSSFRHLLEEPLVVPLLEKLELIGFNSESTDLPHQFTAPLVTELSVSSPSSYSYASIPKALARDFPKLERLAIKYLDKDSGMTVMKHFSKNFAKLPFLKDFSLEATPFSVVTSWLSTTLPGTLELFSYINPIPDGLFPEHCYRDTVRELEEHKESLSYLELALAVRSNGSAEDIKPVIELRNFKKLKGLELISATDVTVTDCEELEILKINQHNEDPSRILGRVHLWDVPNLKEVTFYADALTVADDSGDVFEDPIPIEPYNSDPNLIVHCGEGVPIGVDITNLWLENMAYRRRFSVTFSSKKKRQNSVHAWFNKWN